MHKYERIALWVIIVFLVARVFTMRSGYSAQTPLSIMDLAEFSSIPGDLKQIWQDNITNLIMPAIGTKLTEYYYNNLTSQQLTMRKNKISETAAQVASNIRNLSVEPVTADFKIPLSPPPSIPIGQAYQPAVAYQMPAPPPIPIAQAYQPAVAYKMPATGASYSQPSMA